MEPLLLAISPVNATFFLAVIVLIAAVGLAIVAALNDGDSSKQLFAVVGVLLGLFGAGGLGSLFANQAASEAASEAAPKAAAAAIKQSEEGSPSGRGGSEKTPDKQGGEGTTR